MPRFTNVFNYVPIIGPEGLLMRVDEIRNLSTIPFDADQFADAQLVGRGRWFGSIHDNEIGGWVILLSPDEGLTRPYFSGTIDKATQAGVRVSLPRGDFAGVETQCYVTVDAVPAEAVPESPARFVAFPSFSDDGDIDPDPGRLQFLPGYDTGELPGMVDPYSARGLAVHHAAAMRQLVTTYLPAAIPHLFGGLGLAALVPMGRVPAPFPDLRKLANVDQLREAQAQLALSLAAGRNRHLAEFRDMETAARERFRELMTEIGLANAPAEERASETTGGGGDMSGGVSFGTWIRT
jgi:hypothetical protein